MRSEFFSTGRRLGLLVSALALSSICTGCSSAVDESLDTAGEDGDVGEAAQALSGVAKAFRNNGWTVADTWISNNPFSIFQNNGASATGRIGYKPLNGVAGAQTFATLVRWDLVPKLPKGSTITAATLKLHLKVGIGVQPTIYRVTSPWTEGGVTWANFGAAWAPNAIATGQTGSVNPILGGSFEYTIDVKGLVQDWVDEKLPNYGIAIKTSSTSMYGEIVTNGSSPQLVIAYSNCQLVANGTACDDRNLCTKNDVCTNGQCVGTAVVCAGTQCKAGACDPATGTCSMNPLPDGSACDDNNKCSQSSSCKAGVCAGSNPVVCPGGPCLIAGVCNAATGVCSASTPLTADIQSNITHRWTFDEPSGNAADSVGNAPGVLGTSVSRVTSFNGTNALKLTPTSAKDWQSKVTLQTAEALASQYTVSAWVKTAKPNNVSTLLWSPDVSLQTTLSWYNGSVTNYFPALLGVGASVSVTSNVCDDAWHHLSFVRKPNNFATYVDGVLASSKGYATGTPSASGLTIGDFIQTKNEGPTYTAPFAIEDVRIYSRALSTCDVDALAHPVAPGGGQTCGNGIIEAGEVCDDGSGNGGNSNHILSKCPTDCGVSGFVGAFMAGAVNGRGVALPADGSAVSTWVDLIEGKNAVQTTASQKPIFRAATASNAASVEFDGVDDAMFAPINIDYTKYPSLSVVALFQNAPGGAAGYYGVWGHDNGGYDRFLVSGGNGAQGTGISNGGSFTPVPGIAALGIPLLTVASMNNGAGAGTSHVYLNGDLVTSYAESHNNPGAAQFGIGTINPPPAGNSAFKGNIRFIGIYDHALTAGDAQALQAYLDPLCRSVSSAGQGMGVVPASPALNFPPADAFSVSVQANISPNANQQVLLTKGDALTQEWSLVYKSGQICLTKQGFASTLSCASIGAGSWPRLTMTYSAGAIRWYQNGVAIGQGSGQIGAPQATALTLGGPGAPGISGEIRDLSIWSKALTAGEVSDLANGTRPPQLSAHVAEWAFGEGQGTTVTDVSGNGHAMTLTNMSWRTDVGFAPATSLSTGTYPNNILAIDVNADGKLDLVNTNRTTNNVTVRLGVGDGTFGASTSFAVGATPIGLAAADMNGDGKMDLVATNYDGSTVGVLLGNGSGGFAPVVTFVTGAFPISVALKDINGDGKVDAAIGENNSNNIRVFLNDGAGNLVTPTVLSGISASHNLAMVDMNGDGKVDIVASGYDANHIGVYKGNGDGTFGPAMLTPSVANPNTVSVADFNGDGKLDVATTSYASSVLAVHLGDGALGFSAPQTIPIGAVPRGATMADFNGDGIVDIAVASDGTNNASILLGAGDGTFTLSAAAAGVHTVFPAAGDFNGDGRIDLALTSSSNTLVVLPAIKACK